MIIMYPRSRDCLSCQKAFNLIKLLLDLQSLRTMPPQESYMLKAPVFKTDLNIEYSKLAWQELS